MTPKGPNIASVHPDYEKMRPDWDLIRAFCDGSRAVKALGDKVLPRPKPSDTSRPNLLRYEQYLDRAVFYPVPSRTLDGYVGQVFADAPVVSLPAAISGLESNIDGAGVSLIQQASKTLSYVVSRGRCGLLADYPPVSNAATQAEVEALNLRPTVTLYEPETVVNWQIGQFGGVTKLILVVLHESLLVGSDGFEQQYEESWRVLRLDKGGELVVEIWKRNKEENGYEIATLDDKPMSYMPKQSGKRMTEIPFTFVGSKNNDTSCDNPPLLGLVELSKGHFRNSADYEESVFQVGQPTPYANGCNEEYRKEVKADGGIAIGSRAFILFPPETSLVGLLQPKPNVMAFEAMQHKEKQMVAVGAKLIELSKVATTATEVTIKESATTSALAQMANNVSSAYQWILKRALAFVSPTEDDIEVRLSTDFRTNSLDPSDQAQLVANWQAGALTDTEMRDQFKRGSMTTANIDEWQEWYQTKQQNDQKTSIKDTQESQ